MLMKERIDRHKDGTVKARRHTVDDVPEARRIARRCVKTTAYRKSPLEEHSRAQLSWRRRPECRYEWRWILTASMPKP
jgi:hypothetical protein